MWGDPMGWGCSDGCGDPNGAGDDPMRGWVKGWLCDLSDGEGSDPMGKRGDPICKGKNPIRLFNVENVIFSVCWLATQIPFLNTHLTNFSS